MLLLGGPVSVICRGLEASTTFLSRNLVVEFEISWYFRAMTFSRASALDELHAGAFALLHPLFNDIVWWLQLIACAPPVRRVYP